MFENREEAARLLLRKLEKFAGLENLLILAIPRGGVVVGKVVADTLNLPLDILVIKKVGAPRNSEFALGAVGPDNISYLDDNLCKYSKLNTAEIKKLVEEKDLERLEKDKILRGKNSRLNIRNKTVIVVDDGVATGATVLCAQKYLKKNKAKKLILVIPVIAKDTYQEIKKYFDEIIYLKKIKNFYAVGQFYKEFPQVSDDEVIELLVK